MWRVKSYTTNVKVQFFLVWKHIVKTIWLCGSKRTQTNCKAEYQEILKDEEKLRLNSQTQDNITKKVQDSMKRFHTSGSKTSFNLLVDPKQVGGGRKCKKEPEVEKIPKEEPGTGEREEEVRRQG